MPRLPAKIALALAVLILALGAAELSLRAAGFSHQIKPERVEFGWPHPVTRENLYDTDPALFWVPKDYAEKLGRIEPGTLDLAFLGDSCTEFGEYPERLVALLRARHPGAAIEAANFGVGGWSSYQGLRQFERDVLPLRPRIATFYFGWNDHWIGFGVEDKELGPLAGIASGRWRLGQLALKAQLAHLVRRRTHRPERVAPEDFRSNLTEFSRLAHDNGILPVLLTAPTSNGPGSEPDYLAGRYLRRLEDLVPLHERYADIVRETAAAEGAVLCDLAREFEAYSRDRLENELFQSDGIHPTPAGDARIAELLADCLERNAVRFGLSRGQPGSS